MKISFDESLAIRGAEDFSVSLEGRVTISGGAESVRVSGSDIEYDQSSAADTLIGATVSVYPSGISAEVFTDTPEVCRIEGADVVPLASGMAGVIVRTSRGVRKYEKAVSYLGGAVGNVTAGYAAGSLAEHVHNSIEWMISGRVAGADSKLLYSAANYSVSTPSATRNEDIFSGDLDLSAISFCRASSGHVFPVVLIAPRVAIFAWHVRPSSGELITWMRPDGSFQTVAAGAPALVAGASVDLGVCLLSEAVTGIQPMKTLGADYENRLPVLSRVGGFVAGVKMPALFKGARLGSGVYSNRLDVMPINQLALGFCGNAPPFSGEFLSEFDPWVDAVIGGDSGSPTMIPVNGEPVLLSCQYTAGGGFLIPAFVSQIEAVASGLLGSVVSIGAADLSGFTDFSV